jgi:hypothetical protein
VLPDYKRESLQQSPPQSDESCTEVNGGVGKCPRFRQVRVRAALWKSSAIGDCEREFGPVNTLDSFLYNSIPTVHTLTTTAVDMDTAREWLTWSFSPTIGAMLFTLVLALSLPIIFHLILYRQSAAVTVPSFVLLGPSGAGKTTLLTLVRLQDKQAHDRTLTIRAV